MISAMVLSKGHSFDRGAFYSLFDALDGIRCTHVEHPLAEASLDPALANRFDVLVFYDMPGIRFTRGDGVRYTAPARQTAASLRELGRRGTGFVFLHHAIAGWPSWPGYAEIIGGRFLYAGAPGRHGWQPDSGYRQNVSYTAQCLADGHPVLAGLPASFTLTDELYLMDVDETRVTPLLRAEYSFTAENFYSAAHAVHGRRQSQDGWAHPDGSSLIAWARRWQASPVVYLQPGDSAAVFADPNYRRLLANALRWAASPAARAGR